jgi:membrane associated rhomboid family serine protease
MITRLLVVANVLAFVWEVIASGGGMLNFMGGNTQGVAYVLEAGALWPAAALVDHQWWRIFTSAFLHGGLLHITVNMISLWVLGRFIEAVAGSRRMAVIYFVSLIASGLGVVYLSPAAYATVPTLGASGAIFGLFGALFAIGFKLGRPGMQLIRANIGILVLNLIITFWPGAGIAWEAHVGGLVAGFLLTLVIYAPPKRVAPVVVDANTGDHYETEYQTPEPPR